MHTLKRHAIAWIVLASFFAAPVFADESEDKPEIADQDSYLTDLSILLKKKWPSNRVVNVVCHGHSVPAGYFKTPVVDTFNSYPFLFHQKLKETFPNAVMNVIVTAIGGEHSEAGAWRFVQDVLSHKPDLITIDYALNDRFIGLERAEKAWSSMIEEAKKADVPIILLTPTGDSGEKLDDPNDSINRHAEQIRRLAAKYHVGLADSLVQYQQYIKDGGKLEDLLSQVNHPNRKGHDLVVKVLVPWVPK